MPSHGGPARARSAPVAELQWSNWPVDEFHIINSITGDFAATAPFPPWKPEHPHMGVDIGVFAGTPVLAPAAGRVVSFSNNGSFGIGVCIRHDSDPVWFSLYAHLSEALVSVGEPVEAGQLIGLSGGTGRPPVDPHLHWQVCTSSAFVRDLGQNRDALKVPFRVVPREIPEEEKMGMTAEEKVFVATLADRLGRLEAVVGGNGIDSDGDGKVDKFGDEAIAWAADPQRRWSAFAGIAEARLMASQVNVALFEHASAQDRHD